MIVNSCPDVNIGRTFTFSSCIPGKTYQKAKKHYRNPIAVAYEWQQIYQQQNFDYQSELACYLGISRARVTQVFNILKLESEVKQTIMDLGDPLPTCMITIKELERVAKLPRNIQIQKVQKLLETINSVDF